jgi:Tfp pilus assembly protein PilF
MRNLVLALAFPAIAAAQQPYQYPPPQQPYYQNQYPPPQQQPYYQNQYPQQQQQQQPYYQNQYPPPQQPYYQNQYPQYPQNQYPQYPYPAYPNYPPKPPPPARLTLSTTNEAAQAATWACADAADRSRLELARQKCGEALAKDESLAVTHALLSTVAPPELGKSEMDRAIDLSKRASLPERLLVEAIRAERDNKPAEARKLLDQLVQAVPGEARALLWRGRWKRAAGDIDGAVHDLKQASQLDAKLAVAWGEMALSLAARGQLDEAGGFAKKYAELAPNEPDALTVQARLALRKGDLVEAQAQARKALAVDDKFLAAHAVLGDALLFAGKSKEARKELDHLVAADDPALHHEGAMRQARIWIYEGREVEAERAYTAEADLAQKIHRPGDELDALVEQARVQLDRGALADSGQTLRQAGTLLASKETPVPDADRKRLQPEIASLRIMILGAVGERQMAEQRADELGQLLGKDAANRVTALKGWIAARNGDDKTAMINLAVALQPTLRMALALCSIRAGDTGRAQAIMDELSKRLENDLEGALTRPRALAWMRQNAAPATAAK